MLYIFVMMMFFEEYSLAYRFALIQQYFPRLDEKLVYLQIDFFLLILKEKSPDRLAPCGVWHQCDISRCMDGNLDRR
jgi:hypothetical protein